MPMRREELMNAFESTVNMTTKGVAKEFYDANGRCEFFFTQSCH